MWYCKCAIRKFLNSILNFMLNIAHIFDYTHTSACSICHFRLDNFFFFFCLWNYPAEIYMKWIFFVVFQLNLNGLHKFTKSRFFNDYIKYFKRLTLYFAPAYTIIARSLYLYSIFIAPSKPIYRLFIAIRRANELNCIILLTSSQWWFILYIKLYIFYIQV